MYCIYSYINCISISFRKIAYFILEWLRSWTQPCHSICLEVVIMTHLSSHCFFTFNPFILPPFLSLSLFFDSSPLLSSPLLLILRVSAPSIHTDLLYLWLTLSHPLPPPPADPPPPQLRPAAPLAQLHEPHALHPLPSPPLAACYSRPLRGGRARRGPLGPGGPR